MTPDPTAGQPVPLPTNVPPTLGMTTKVFKGSVWTLAGQVAPMAFSLIATPFVIRLLGAEGYGVLILVGLIPTYLAFADFGMGLASTKFASQAFSKNEPDAESAVVWTASSIAALFSLPIAILLAVYSGPLAELFNIPEHLHWEASISLKIGAVTLILNFLVNIFNTPQLARLRMDLNALVNTVPKLLMIVATPLVLYFGGGIVGAVILGSCTSLVMLVSHFSVSSRLQPSLSKVRVDQQMIEPLLKFGGGLLVALIASMLLINLEKLLLTRLVSVESLAYYSVAFTFSTMATMLSFAMIQSLIPAFSQLLGTDRKEAFDALFSNSVRFNLLWLLPAAMILAVAAEPLFTIWAGADFGRQSTVPFYVLLFGLLFNVVAYVPHSVITALGRTDVFAKLYWVELALYFALAYWLISTFQILGAAIAWSLRVALDAVAIIWLARRLGRVPLGFLRDTAHLLLVSFVLLPPIFFAVLYDNFSLWLLVVTPVCLIFYSFLVWTGFLSVHEREWAKERFLGGSSLQA